MGEGEEIMRLPWQNIETTVAEHSRPRQGSDLSRRRGQDNLLLFRALVVCTVTAKVEHPLHCEMDHLLHFKLEHPLHFKAWYAKDRVLHLDKNLVL